MARYFDTIDEARLWLRRYGKSFKNKNAYIIDRMKLYDFELDEYFNENVQRYTITTKDSSFLRKRSHVR
jgi:hypothetical protein